MLNVSRAEQDLLRYRTIRSGRTSNISEFMHWFRKHTFLLLAVCLCIAEADFLPYLQKTGHTPPVGVYIAIMGLIAACVAFRKEPRPSEKAAWVVVMTLLMVAEIKNLYVADREQLDRFTKVYEGLKSTKSGLDSTASGLNETLNQLTGRNSYFYLMPNQPMFLNGFVAVNALPTFVGKYPIHDLFVSLDGTTLDDNGRLYRWDHFYGTYFPDELGRPREIVLLRFRETDQQPIRFFVSINGSNGTRSEIIYFEKNGDAWKSALIVTNPITKQHLCKWVEPGFPPMTDTKEFPTRIWSGREVHRTPATAQPPCK